MAYDLKSVKAPKTSGTALRLLVFAAETPGSKDVLSPLFLANAGIDKMRTVEAKAGYPGAFLLPTYFKGERTPSTQYIKNDEVASVATETPDESFRFETAADFVEAYKSGKHTPTDVAETLTKVIPGFGTGKGSLHVFSEFLVEPLKTAAEASTQRWKDGKPLGPLDGVPVIVKDEIDVEGYRTTVGTTVLGKTPAAADGEVVKRLREQGALIIGKSVMPELGMSVTGVSPTYGTPDNPYAPGHVAGGSSGGSAAAVASGLCPIALGADAGGSVRIPASFCGVYGIKPTYGRVSSRGAHELAWTNGHIGPIAASTTDLALAYAVIAGHDDDDPVTHHQPKPYLKDWEKGEVDGLKLGVFRPWFDDCDGEVKKACDDMVAKLAEGGAEVVDVRIPNLRLASTVHLVTVVSEMAASGIIDFGRNRAGLSLATRLNLALAQSLSPSDYIHAQRLRVSLINSISELMREVDVILTPTVPCVAPQVSATAHAGNESDIELTTKIMRYAFLANATGFPAISFPVGYGKHSLPIGMQAMAGPWEEHTLFSIARFSERFLVKAKPQRSVRFLEG